MGQCSLRAYSSRMYIDSGVFLLETCIFHELRCGSTNPGCVCEGNEKYSFVPTLPNNRGGGGQAVKTRMRNKAWQCWLRINLLYYLASVWHLDANSICLALSRRNGKGHTTVVHFITTILVYMPAIAAIREANVQGSAGWEYCDDLEADPRGSEARRGKERRGCDRARS